MSRNDRRALTMGLLLCACLASCVGLSDRVAPKASKWPWAPPVCPCKI